MTDFRALCSELLEKYDLEWRARERIKTALAQPEPQGPKLIYRYSPATIAECGGPCEQGPQYCDCGQIKGEPEPQGPTQKEAVALYSEVMAVNNCQTLGEMAEHFARAVLARWGRPAVEPVPVSERLPGQEDCTTNPRTGQGHWCWGWVQHDDLPYSGRWRMMRQEWLASEAMAWLPHWALPLPEQEVSK